MTGENMARRSTLTTDDLTKIEEALSGAIADRLGEEAKESGEIITNVAPLFAVREKIVAMRGKANGPVDRTPRATRTRRPKPLGIGLDEA
jgi:hypothetical protein